MSTRRALIFAAFLCFLILFTACDTDTYPTATTNDTETGTGGNDTSTGNNDSGNSSDSSDYSDVENIGDHDSAADYIWNDADIIRITLNGTAIQADASGTTVDGSTLTITSAGTYDISGSLTDGRIIVDTTDKDIVRLILDQATIHNATGAPIYIKNARKAMIVMAGNTTNHISDGTSYRFDDSGSDEPNAAIFSAADLTIYGNGSLTVDGNYNDGIASKDGLIITSGAITVHAADDGIRGKDYIVVKGGDITVDAKGDGMKSDNDTDASRGYITIEKGTFDITSGGDAITAVTDVAISDGVFKLVSGGGCNGFLSNTLSAKGIKGPGSVVIDKGTFTIDSADDAVHSNNSLTINNGTFTVSSGDDGFHADSTLEINGGNITITESYEGIESAVLTINGGTMRIVSSDDGINGAGGTDGSGFEQRPGQRGGGGGGFTTTGNYYLYINGGYIMVDAMGDGIDINGSITMTDGVVLVNGPTANMNGALDYDGSFKISGGFLVAAGSSGMAQAPDGTSSQNSLLLTMRTTFKAGTLFTVKSGSGDVILSFMPNKQYQSVAFSSPDLTKGTSYDVYSGGNSTGSQSDGLFTGGTYTPGTQYASFTVSGTVTKLTK